MLPKTDELIAAVAGRPESEIERGAISWSNELVLHVVELKTGGPAAALEPLPALFQEQVERIDAILEDLGGRLMPTAMHPWMDPARETELWPHEHSRIYETFDRIFGCEGHGWSNLQSMHLNLPFAGDEEFGRLHAAIRLLLPLLPALAASSPIVEGRVTGSLDSRMETYRGNAGKVPSVGGEVIPEPAFSRRQYDELIFEPMMREIAPHDPEGVLDREFLNSRGAIARFSRGSIEIRVIDVQETPGADLAIAALTVAVLEMLIEEHWGSIDVQRSFGVALLAAILRRAIVEADRAEVVDRGYLEALGVTGGPATCSAIWRHLADAAVAAGRLDGTAWGRTLEVLLEHGPLARRILAAVGPDPSRPRIEAVYRQLCDCLVTGRLFVPA